MLSDDLDSILRNEGCEAIDAGLRQQFLAEFKPGRIRPSTNRGVRLGMSKGQVRGILGKPHRVVQRKRVPALQYVYVRPKGMSPEHGERIFREYYAFRNGKLFYIEHANRTTGPG